MKFLVDAQLPASLCNILVDSGHSCIHVKEILTGFNSPDDEIINYADANDLIVITKDKDFPESFRLSGRPKRLVKISVGNCSNASFYAIFRAALPAIIKAMDASICMVEMFHKDIVIHQK